MFKQLLIVSSALVALVNSTTALSAREPMRLKPVNDWQVAEGESQCSVSRVFGSADQPHVLYFDQFAPSRFTGMTATGPQLKGFRHRRPTALWFFAGQAPHRIEPFAGESEEYGKALIHNAIDPATGPWREIGEEESAGITAIEQLDTELASRMEFVSLKQGGREVRYETGALDEAFSALNRCTRQMVTGWGLDADQQFSATRAPKWLNQAKLAARLEAAYPRSALFRGEQAVFQMRVIVDEQGGVADCSIKRTTDAEKLVSPACEVMQDARFEPALGSDGHPIRSFYVTSITYLIG